MTFTFIYFYIIYFNKSFLFLTMTIMSIIPISEDKIFELQTKSTFTAALSHLSLKSNHKDKQIKFERHHTKHPKKNSWLLPISLLGTSL